MNNHLLGQNTLKNQKGVTLIEMAVVVSIIALLLAGTLGGTSLYQASKLRRLSTEIIQYETAIRTFKEEYHYWPGDFNQATAFWSSDDSDVSDGGGDGFVQAGYMDATGESLKVPNHLGNAELIPRKYTGLITDPGNVHFTAGVNVPQSQAFKNLVFAFESDSAAATEYIHGTHAGHFFRVATLNANGEPWGTAESLNSKQSKAVDEKIDDGKATTGRLVVTSCFTGREYTLSNTTKDCKLQFYIERF